MIPMALSEIADAVEARCPAGGRNIRIHRVTTDSRDVEAGDLFVAIEGDRFDGHDFIEQAAAKGAAACVCAAHEGRPRDPDRIGDRKRARATPRLEVCDTVEALGRLAAHYRSSVMSASTTVVAVTGSNGKTTTKCMIDHVLRQSIKGRSSPKSFNNAIGVPLSILAVEADDRYLIAEIGSNAPGEVASLAAIVSPDLAVITSIGEAHLEGLGDLRSIAVEKASLLAHVRPGGLAVVNIDRPELEAHLRQPLRCQILTFGLSSNADLRATGVRGAISHTSFELDGLHRVELPLPGVHHATNAAAAYVVAQGFGLTGEEIVDRLRSLTAPEGRTQLHRIGDVTLIDDSYNANPASMAAAIDTLRQQASQRRVFVMGDMLELGRASAALHRRVVRAVCEARIEVLMTVGPATANAAEAIKDGPDGPRVFSCADADAAGDALAGMLEPGDTIWVKASRAMQLDRVVCRVRTEHEPRALARADVRAG
ncbi:MAG: UDP-N-acetylmuramoyl-tripeptide--D-alanyl-D-alanine ligase [Planctomycetota bacterium]|jgi:UDP-N-acetylmuramoyl-tripeptide--D-alanyl-D-alanine ligase